MEHQSRPATIPVALTDAELAGVTALAAAWETPPEQVLRLALAACGITPREGGLTCRIVHLPAAEAEILDDLAARMELPASWWVRRACLLAGLLVQLPDVPRELLIAGYDDPADFDLDDDEGFIR